MRDELALTNERHKAVVRKLENDLKKVRENEQHAYDNRDRAIREKNELIS
jgi:hypothetical protein